MTQHIMIGLGAIGLPVANQLAKSGLSLIGISRTAKMNLDKNIQHIQLDARTLSPQHLKPFLSTISHITITVTPSRYDETSYHESYFQISQAVIKLSQYLPNLQRVFFVSSTGVYGQNSAEVIDIHSPILPPARVGSQIILQTEQLLQQHFVDKCTIIRPSGIYGEQRLALVNLVKKLATDKQIAIPENTWTNRIMDIDLIHVMIKILMENNPLAIYLVTDNQPVPLYNVLNYLALQLRLDIQFVETLPTTGKQILNNLPSDWLNFTNFQQGYQHILAKLH